MHVVDVDRNGERTRLTLRRLNQPEWGMDAELARKEWEVLSLLRDTPVPAPEPVWMETEGEIFGVPALLLRHLPGRPVLDPDDLDGWAAGLASVLAAIHAVDLDVFAGVLPDETREQRLLRHLAEEIGDVALASPTIDARLVVSCVLERLGDAPTHRGLVHGDFHPGNVLWADGRVSGVVDWPAARIGDPRIDLAYLRLDTALVLGEHAPSAMLDAYEKATGAPVDDLAVWDLLAVTTGLPEPVSWLDGYLELGRTDLDADTIRRRYREFTARALKSV
jgi:prepilin-type processing-associated H-X9-DG protein